MKFKPFDRILVREGVWKCTIFSNYVRTKDNTPIPVIKTISGEVYHEDFVLPYEGNEDLVGTSKNVPTLKVIKGNSEKGKDVISMLERMGGSNAACGFIGTDEKSYYYINENNEIEKSSIDSHHFNRYKLDIMELPKRWRGHRGEIYYFIEDSLRITQSFDHFTHIENDRYRVGNYFKSIQDATEAADKIKKILDNE